MCGFLNPRLGLERAEISSELLNFLGTGSPPVYVTFGSMMPYEGNYLAETVAIWKAGIDLVGCRAILQIPNVALAKTVAGADIFTVPWSPHAQVFPACAMIVSAGPAPSDALVPPAAHGLLNDRP